MELKVDTIFQGIAPQWLSKFFVIYELKGGTTTLFQRFDKNWIDQSDWIKTLMN